MPPKGNIMNKLYKKDETLFAVAWIAIYVVGMSLANEISDKIGITCLVTALFNIALSAVLFMWIKSQGLFEKYGLCRAKTSAASMLFYIPLIIIASRNFWLGFGINMPAVDTAFYIASMLAVD